MELYRRMALPPQREHNDVDLVRRGEADSALSQMRSHSPSVQRSAGGGSRERSVSTAYSAASAGGRYNSVPRVRSNLGPGGGNNSVSAGRGGGDNAAMQRSSVRGSSPTIPQHLLWDVSRLRRRAESPLTQAMKRIKLEEEEIDLDSPTLFRMALQQEEEESSGTGTHTGSRAQSVSVSRRIASLPRSPYLQRISSNSRSPIGTPQQANLTPEPYFDPTSPFIDPNRPDIEYL